MTGKKKEVDVDRQNTNSTVGITTHQSKYLGS